jgi:ATP synthase F1 complex assembly factor 1
MQMSLVEKEPASTVKMLWEEYHAPRTENIAMTFTSDIYSTLFSRLKEANMFMLPVKREGGHFMMISQNQDNSLLFTFLQDYKQHQIFANPYFIFTFFTELQQSKDIVLGRGDIIDQKITREEARELMKSFFMFYMTSDLYEDFVQNFNFDSSKFNYSKFCDHLNIQKN